MVVLILCAGSQARFESVTPKQLMPFNGKPLLERTIKQVKNPYIVTRNDNIKDFCYKKDVSLFYPQDNSKCVNTLLSTKEIWRNKVIVLLGDVYYNQKCLDLTFNCNKEICFVGNGVEIFSISFTPHTKVIKSLEIAAKHEIGKLWHFYRAYNGIPLNEHKRDLGLVNLF